MEIVKVFLFDKDNEVQYGLNWGQRDGREPNQAYLQLTPEVYRSDFFPVKKHYFLVDTDDGFSFVMNRGQKGEDGSALETPEDNSLLGKYLRKRLGVPENSRIEKSAIEAYGRSDIDFVKIGMNHYKMDFSLNHSFVSSEVINQSRNRIIFGAPGTGKSHSLELDRKNNFADDCYERVTFHPNSSYAQFVGTYKPTMTVKETDSSLTDEQKQILSILKDKNRSGQEKYDLLYDKFRDDSDLTRLPLLIGIYSDDEFRTKKADGSYTANDNGVERNHGRAVRPYINLNLDCVKEEITYEYIPGSFMRIYVAAKQNPSQNFLLLIEEINRANVAAVFGDVFQLLDRDENGNSEYPVAASEDIKKYLAKNGIHEDELKIPSNMYIWATMNSADQGVFPMDTAFKRRWEFEYIDINKNADKLVYKDNKPILVPIPVGNITESKEKNNLKYSLYKWNDVREKINEKLSEISSVSEDKLLGPFFINLEKLRSAKNEPQEFIELFKSKVLMYLFEDVVKISPTKLFEKCGDHPRYSTICSKFDEIGCGIFGFELEKQISSESEPSETANE